MFDSAAPLTRTLLFGSFSLSPSKRLLLENGQRVPLGSRAFDLLVLLTERAGELLTKEELTARVWPNTTVAEANLSVQLAALRRALRDGRDGNRYIVNEPGRGYWFVASVTSANETQPAVPSSVQSLSLHDLSASVRRLIEACGGDSVLQGCAASTDPGKELSDPPRAIEGILQCGIWALELARTLLPLATEHALTSPALGR